MRLFLAAERHPQVQCASSSLSKHLGVRTAAFVYKLHKIVVRIPNINSTDTKRKIFAVGQIPKLFRSVVTLAGLKASGE